MRAPASVSSHASAAHVAYGELLRNARGNVLLQRAGPERLPRRCDEAIDRALVDRHGVMANIVDDLVGKAPKLDREPRAHHQPLRGRRLLVGLRMDLRRKQQCRGENGFSSDVLAVMKRTMRASRLARCENLQAAVTEVTYDGSSAAVSARSAGLLHLGDRFAAHALELRLDIVLDPLSGPTTPRAGPRRRAGKRRSGGGRPRRGRSGRSCPRPRRCFTVSPSFTSIELRWL